MKMIEHTELQLAEIMLGHVIKAHKRILPPTGFCVR